MCHVCVRASKYMCAYKSINNCSIIIIYTFTFYFAATWICPRTFHHASTRALIIFREAFLRIHPFPEYI